MQQTTTTTTMESSNNGNESEELFMYEKGLDAQGMISRGQPQQHGVVMKLHTSILFTILPTCLQRFICSYERLSSWAGPHWQQRYLILVGKFLYKFKNETSIKPKGTPFSVEKIEAHCIQTSTALIVDDDLAPTLCKLPPQYDYIVEVSTFRKKHYYAVLSKEDANMWLDSLHLAKEETIKRNMGHSNNMPYPEPWKYYDQLGSSYQKRKERIKAKMDEYEKKDFEMTSLRSGGILS